MADFRKKIKLLEPFSMPPIPPPADLSSFLASQVSPTEMQLSWLDLGFYATHYIIQWSLNAFFSGASSATITANPNSGSIYLITGLNPSTLYYFRIKATNSSGDSGWASTSETTL